jgi:UDP-GlcNAc:undecaprenyl-phosphate/decaprenyl-phosphate GlcNAc-1-phosphate transferase
MLLLVINIFLLLLSIFIYFHLAHRFAIVDKPSERGAHTEETLRGLGIIFMVAGVLSYMSSYLQGEYFWTGFFVIGFISFWDDVRSLPNRVRLSFQFLAIGLLLFQVSNSYQIPIWAWFFLIILCVGIVNAYNFMDGINGITGLYSLVAMVFLYNLLTIQLHLIDKKLFQLFIIAIIIFLFLNFRKKAIGFGGDVGSISLAYILLFLMLILIFYTKDIKYIFFLGLYGIDTIYTLVYRLLRGENIFKAHKLHFFQILLHQYKWSHLQISSLYGIVQLFWNILILKSDIFEYKFYLFPIVILGTVHFCRYQKKLAIGQRNISTE